MPQPAEWECPNCHERNPEQFDVCWNCQTNRASGAIEPDAEESGLGALEDVMARDAAEQDTKNHLLKRKGGYRWLPLYAAILRLLAPLYAIGAAVFAVFATVEHENLLLGFVILIAAALGVVQILATAEAAELLLSLDRRVERGRSG